MRRNSIVGTFMSTWCYVWISIVFVVGSLLLPDALASMDQPSVGSFISDRVQMALNAHKEGNLDTALSLYEKVLSSNRETNSLNRKQVARIHINAGGIFYQQSRRVDAISHFEDALLCDADLTEAHLNLAIVLYDDPTKLERAEHHAQLALASRAPTRPVQQLHD
jgi:tetratricopeptide (TPR) repeat protein